MIELGKVQELVIIRTKEFGVYLAEKEGDEAAVLLPKKQVPEGAGIGDKVEVFIYKDSSEFKCQFFHNHTSLLIYFYLRFSSHMCRRQYQ